MLQYKQVDQVIFEDIIITPSLSSIGLPNLEEGKYIFQISSVLTINNVKYNGPISSPMIVIISGQVSLMTHSFCPLTITETLSCLIPSSTPLLVSQESWSRSSNWCIIVSSDSSYINSYIKYIYWTTTLLYCHKRKYTITKLDGMHSVLCSEIIDSVSITTKIPFL